MSGLRPRPLLTVIVLDLVQPVGTGGELGAARRDARLELRLAGKIDRVDAVVRGAEACLLPLTNPPKGISLPRVLSVLKGLMLLGGPALECPVLLGF